MNALTVNDLVIRVQLALDGKGDLATAAKVLTDALSVSEEDQWMAAFDAQWELWGKLEELLTEAGRGKGDHWNLAMLWYLAEHMTERARLYLHLDSGAVTSTESPSPAETFPARCPACGAGRVWLGEAMTINAADPSTRRVASCQACGNATLDLVP